ncbi:MAG: hypothetical protein JWO72_3126, partial [Caulobacteraceae bacterium]|nr:hypothetical protein [Caulobacteraceae bacterium]
MRDHDALIALVESRVRAPLAWGTHDCVAFAAACAQAQTGRDFHALMGCTWRTARGAHRLLRARGGLEAATDSVLTRVAPALAHRGDVGLVEIEGRASLVVIEGD